MADRELGWFTEVEEMFMQFFCGLQEGKGKAGRGEVTTWQGSWRSPLGKGKRHIPRPKDPSWSNSAFPNMGFPQLGHTRFRGCHLFCHSPYMRARADGFPSVYLTFIIPDVPGSNIIDCALWTSQWLPMPNQHSRKQH